MIFAPEARYDLIALTDWITERAGTDIALAYAGRLEDHCMSFEFAGERGQRRDDLRPGFRVTGFERRVTIVFSVTETEVTILRLYYGGQNWPKQSS